MYKQHKQPHSISRSKLKAHNGTGKVGQNLSSQIVELVEDSDSRSKSKSSSSSSSYQANTTRDSSDHNKNEKGDYPVHMSRSYRHGNRYNGYNHGHGENGDNNGGHVDSFIGGGGGSFPFGGGGGGGSPFGGGFPFGGSFGGFGGFGGGHSGNGGHGRGHGGRGGGSSIIQTSTVRSGQNGTHGRIFGTINGQPFSRTFSSGGGNGRGGGGFGGSGGHSGGGGGGGRSFGGNGYQGFEDTNGNVTINYGNPNEPGNQTITNNGRRNGGRGHGHNNRYGGDDERDFTYDEWLARSRMGFPFSNGFVQRFFNGGLSPQDFFDGAGFPFDSPILNMFPTNGFPPNVLVGGGGSGLGNDFGTGGGGTPVGGNPIPTGVGGGLVSSDDYTDDQRVIDDIVTMTLDQYDGRNGPPPASEETINSLPRREVTDSDVAKNAECPVCLEALSTGETVIDLPCEHLIHRDCGEEWLKKHGTCPICRKHVSEGSNQRPNPPPPPPPPSSLGSGSIRRIQDVSDLNAESNHNTPSQLNPQARSPPSNIARPSSSTYPSEPRSQDNSNGGTVVLGGARRNGRSKLLDKFNNNR
ncbi:hypothetical protein H4219_005861 [Mycoemilia scoparia]|uniref:RING-type E3 ubiquitin transferase n=1 Tax=Mycoemilia scoparia TaxID=417184 RepID=A0A9W7ZL30_9FUNG|nr:hypothetical protein H4219_005861 [Mycoemilia scoparia]